MKRTRPAPRCPTRWTAPSPASATGERLEAQIGAVADVLVDAPIGGGLVQGRLASQAPEIDGVTFLKAPGAEAGDLVRARISGVRDRIDLEAEAI
jgi:hypothetical protein